MRLSRGNGWAQLADVVTASTPSPAPIGVLDPSTLPIASPWGSSAELNRIVAEDVFGSGIPVNTRSAAMRLPAVAKGRHKIVSAIANLPLVAMQGDTPTPTQPGWMTRTNQATSPQLRLAWTVDDLIFYGWSLWARLNGTDGFPLMFDRVERSSWSIDGDNDITIHGIKQDPSSVCLIPGMHEGILGFGHEALADARDLYAMVRTRIRNPIPGLDLHQVDGDPLNDEEIDKLIDRWATARRGGNGGVAFTNKSIEAKLLGSADAELLIEARNAVAVDMARLLGISAGLLDATTPKASLNYETQAGRNWEFVDQDLQLYMAPIEWRLSLDDVVPRGQRAAFDVSQFTRPDPAPTGAPLED